MNQPNITIATRNNAMLRRQAGRARRKARAAAHIAQRRYYQQLAFLADVYETTPHEVERRIRQLQSPLRLNYAA